MKSNIKKTFRNYLLIGLIPILGTLTILILMLWALANKNQKDVEQPLTDKMVVHDTVYVKVQCERNHFETPKQIETSRKREVKPEIVPTEVTQKDTSN